MSRPTLRSCCEPDVSGTTRTLAAVLHRRVLGLCLCGVAVAGCNAALSKREVVVHFTPQATSVQHRDALDACADASPHASPEPIVHDRYASSRGDDIRFRIDKANDSDLARLYNCLSRQPGVVGVSDPLDMTR